MTGAIQSASVSMNADPQVGEALEHAAQDHLPQRAARVEGVLQRQRHDGGESRRTVGRRARATVLADRQTDLHAAAQTGSSAGSKKKIPPGRRAGIMTPPRPCSLAQWMSSHRQLDVVERNERLPGSAPRRLRAEVGQPAVVGQTRLTIDLGVGERAHVVRRPRLEGQPVREEHLGHDALALHVLQAEVRVPLRGGVEARAQIAALGSAGRLLRPGPGIEHVEEPLLDVVPVLAAGRTNVPVHRDDRGLRHRPPFRHACGVRGGDVSALITAEPGLGQPMAHS